MKILSLFSGLGAFEKSLKRNNIDFSIVNYCEIDKYASKSYSLLHNVSEDLNLGDIVRVDVNKLGIFDLMTWGFPCTDISVAGKQKGFVDEDGKITRSGLYYEGLRILKAKLPKYSIIENVKALTQKKFKNEFEQILKDLEELGYNNYWEVLNSKDYGIPQNRERVFIISIRKDIDDGGFEFPTPFDNSLRLKDLLEECVGEKYYINRDKSDKLIDSLNLDHKINIGTYNQNDGFRKKNIFCTLDASYYKGLGCNQDRNAIAVQINHGELKEFNNEVHSTPLRFLDRNQKVLPSDYSMCIDTSNTTGVALLKIGNVNPSGKGINGEVYSDDGLSPTITTNKGEGPKILQVGMLDMKGNEEIRRVDSSDGISPTLTTMQGGNTQPKIVCEQRTDEGLRFFKNDVIGTIRTKDSGGDKRVIEFDDKVVLRPERTEYGKQITVQKDNLVYSQYRIRKLTPLECFRLMGFNDEDYYILKENGISNTQLYKMAGNSIVVNVLDNIFQNLFKTKNNIMSA